jgi:hypothetical protein
LEAYSNFIFHKFLPIRWIQHLRTENASIFDIGWLELFIIVAIDEIDEELDENLDRIYEIGHVYYDDNDFFSINKLVTDWRNCGNQIANSQKHVDRFTES